MSAQKKKIGTELVYHIEGNIWKKKKKNVQKPYTHKHIHSQSDIYQSWMLQAAEYTR